MSPLRVLTLSVAALLIVVGLLLAFGLIGPETPEPTLRVVVGVVIVLMGIYRGAVALIRDRTDRP